MANRNIFVAPRTAVRPNTINEAGGQAFALSKKEALAQYVVTGTFNGTFYASAEEQVDKVLELCKEVNDPTYVAKLAVYAREQSKMKDTPVVLLAWLASQGYNAQVKLAFPRICNNFKQVSNFAQVIRSGKLGRKSFGTVLKNLINSYLTETDADKLFTSTVGVGNPSIADVLKMTHPKGDAKHNALFGYFLGKKYNKRYLPSLVKSYKAFQEDKTLEVPNVPFQLLTSLGLNVSQWTEVAKNMPWNTLRQNLNSMEGKGVFADNSIVAVLAEKLVDRKGILYSKAFPYSIMSTYINTNGKVPVKISNALQDALEIATQNVPSITGDVAVLVDISGSMNNPVTGERKGATTKVTCTQVAALVASTILRKNDGARIIVFDTDAREMSLNPRDSVATNAQRLSLYGGGTDVSCGVRLLNSKHFAPDVVIILSDNQSWYGMNNTHQEWVNLKKRNPKAKLVLIDLQPYSSTVVGTQKDVLNVGGFSDEVFNVISRFVSGENNSFIKTIEEIQL